MGYLHDVSLSIVLPAPFGMKTGESWTLTRTAEGLYEEVKGFAAEAFYLMFPVSLPASAGTKRGVRLDSIDFYYEVKTSDLVKVYGNIELQDLPANGAAMSSPAEPDVTSEGPDSKVVGNRRVRVVPDADLWLDPEQICRAVLTVETPVDTCFYYCGARINYTLRE
jgi:hypothetical protein